MTISISSLTAKANAPTGTVVGTLTAQAHLARIFLAKIRLLKVLLASSLYPAATWSRNGAGQSPLAIIQCAYTRSALLLYSGSANFVVAVS
jgi:hypothetical protein